MDKTSNILFRDKVVCGGPFKKKSKGMINAKFWTVVSSGRKKGEEAIRRGTQGTSKILLMFYFESLYWVQVYYYSLSCISTLFYKYEIYHNKHVIKVILRQGNGFLKDAETNSTGEHYIRRTLNSTLQ